MAKNTYAVQVKNLKKSYGKTEVLKGIDLLVEKGTMLALLGPNGAGKTTTVNCFKIASRSRGSVELQL